MAGIVQDKYKIHSTDSRNSRSMGISPNSLPSLRMLHILFAFIKYLTGGVMAMVSGINGEGEFFRNVKKARSGRDF